MFSMIVYHSGQPGLPQILVEFEGLPLRTLQDLTCRPETGIPALQARHDQVYQYQGTND